MSSRGINKVILIGNLGVDPETRYTQGGAPVTNFRLATSEQWRDKQSNENRERTEWHSVVCFGRLAEIAGEVSPQRLQGFRGRVPAHQLLGKRWANTLQNGNHRQRHANAR